MTSWADWEHEKESCGGWQKGVNIPASGRRERKIDLYMLFTNNNNNNNNNAGKKYTKRMYKTIEIELMILSGVNEKEKKKR